MGIITKTILSTSKLILPNKIGDKVSKCISNRNTIKFIRSERNRTGSAISQFDAYKAIFIHIPKTGGTSISNVMFGSNAGHYEWYLLNEVFGELYEQYFKFAIIRNPWDRLLSAYKYLTSERCTDANKVWVSNQRLYEYTFEKFVLHKLTDVLNYPHFKPQSDFVCNSNNEIKVDFIGRLENINKDFNFIQNQLGFELKLPHFNKSKEKADYSSFYTSEMTEYVSNIYNRDIANFDFSF